MCFAKATETIETSTIACVSIDPIVFYLMQIHHGDLSLLPPSFLTFFPLKFKKAEFEIYEALGHII